MLHVSLRGMMSAIRVAIIAIAVAVLATEHGRAATATFTEDFSTSTKRGATTTAVWNTLTRMVTLPTQAPSWQTMAGLIGQEVSAVAFSSAYAQDQTVFVGVADGIFQSKDGGGTWVRVASTSRSVESIAVSPAYASDRTAFAITNGDGTWKTSDGGTTWVKVHSASGFRIAVSPAYASDRTAFAADIAHVYETSDGGTTWTTSSTGISPEVLANGDIRGIAISSAYASDRTVYATTFSFGVYRSTDGGTTWTAVNPTNIEVASAKAIAVGAEGRVAAAFLNGVYATANAGDTWTLVYSGDANDLVYVPGTSTLLIASSSGILRAQAGAIASGWSGEDAQAVGAAATYSAAESVIGGWSGGAARLTTEYTPSAVAISTPVVSLANPIIRATVTPTVSIPIGTSVAWDMSVASGVDGEPIWEGPVETGKPWAFTSAGTMLRWRARLATIDPAATPTLRALTITYENAAFPLVTPPTPTGAVPAPKSIRWTFIDTTTDETGYEIHDAQDRVLATTEPNPVNNLTYLDESELIPNTEYCGRRVVTLRDTETSSPSAPYFCAVTLAETPATASATEVTSSSARLSFLIGSNPSDTEYAVQDRANHLYVGVDRKLGASEPIWQTASAWERPILVVYGLASNTPYTFCIAARNRVGVETPCSTDIPIRTPPAPVFRGALVLDVRPAPTVVQPVAVGGTMDWLIAVENRGDGNAYMATVTSPIPDGTTYVPGTLTRDGIRLTDVRDGDAGDVDITESGSVTFVIGMMRPGAQDVFGYRTTVADDAGAMVALRGRASYQPISGVKPTVVDAGPALVAIARGERQPIERPNVPEVPRREVPGERAFDGGDSTAPAIRIASPADETALEDGEVVIEGFTGIVRQMVEVLVDGAVIGGVRTDARGVFVMTIRNLAPGQQTIVAMIPGARAEVRVFVPQPPDALILMQPTNGAVTNTQSVIATGRGPIGAHVAFAVDGTAASEATIDAAGNFTIVVAASIAEGAHALVAVMTLPNEKSEEVRAMFTIDRTPPSAPTVIEVAVPKRVASSVVEGKFDATIELRGSFPPEEFPMLDALLITVGPEPVTFILKPSSSDWTYTAVIPLEPGMHTVRVAARDIAGNVSLQPEILTFEVLPPECSDGVDNNGDGFMDHPNDSNCTSPFDDREAPTGVVERAVTIIRDATSAVARTTTIAAQATAKVAERAATVVLDKVIENPTVQATSERVVAPMVAVAVAANTATATAAQGFQFFTYLQYIGGIILQPWRLLTHRRRKQWGTVYDSLTKRPIDLATVRLIETRTKKIVRSEVTDSQGRYGFIIDRPGTYHIEVHRNGYTFPSALLKRKHEDAAFVDLYYGEEMTITGAIFTMNIPLDAKERAEESGEHAVRAHYLRLVSSGVSNTGLVLAFASFGITPRPFVGAILLLNIASYFFFRRLAAQTKRPKSWGVVTDVGSKDPLHLAIVQLFDEEYHKLLETTVTDRYGRYSFLVGKNVFDITAQKAGYESSKSKPIDHTEVESIVAVDIPLKPEAGVRHQDRS